MEIYALTGKSGTGKSFQANNLANELGIESIIDDGLFIFGGSIVAGISAKRQETQIGAIKTALFKKADHCEEVKAKIHEIDPKSILIIGTSEKMVRLIAARLGLPDPIKWIEISEVTSQNEIELARKQRNEYGQHVIPAPTFQVKKDFSGYFIHPMRLFREFVGDRPQIPERSVVRPTYSYLGKYSLSDKAIDDIVGLVAKKIPSVDSVSLLYLQNRAEGVRLEIEVIMVYGAGILTPVRYLQQEIAREIEAMTALNILSVDIEIRGLMWSR